MWPFAWNIHGISDVDFYHSFILTFLHFSPEQATSFWRALNRTMHWQRCPPSVCPHHAHPLLSTSSHLLQEHTVSNGVHVSECPKANVLNSTPNKILHCILNCVPKSMIVRKMTQARHDSVHPLLSSSQQPPYREEWSCTAVQKATVTLGKPPPKGGKNDTGIILRQKKAFVRTGLSSTRLLYSYSSPYKYFCPISKDVSWHCILYKCVLHENIIESLPDFKTNLLILQPQSFQWSILMSLLKDFSWYWSLLMVPDDGHSSWSLRSISLPIDFAS